MADPGSGVTIVDGSLDFSGGVDSLKVTTIQSQANPNGLGRNQEAWLVNGTVRDGGITQRTGWQPIGTIIPGPAPLYQGGFMYEPTDGVSFPYLVLNIGGNIYKVDPNALAPFAAINLSQNFGLTLPPTQPQSYFAQAEDFLIIQAGDGVTLPLFWDNNILRQSRGLITNAPAIAFTVNLTNVNVTAGTVFQAQTGTNNPLGVPYVSFTAGVIGGTQTVPLLAPYAGNVGDTINYTSSGTGTMTLQSITPSGTGHNYNYINNSIPSGASVPAQFAQGNNPGTGRNFPAFTAPGIGGPISFFSSSILVNPGITNTLAFTSNLQFTVAAISGTVAQAQALISEIPPATAMDYYMGRLWYAQGYQVAAGDIVDGTNGTAQYQFRDSVLKITENPLALGGDGFRVPSSDGIVRALFHNANINTQLGQGQLFIGTRKSIYNLQVPVTRTDWIAATNSNQPLMTAAQLFYGPVNDRSVVKVNADIYYQSLEPAIRSFFMSLRDFTQYANVPISSNIDRVLSFNNRALLHYGSGILFDNRIWETQLPRQTPQGVVHDAVAILDFQPISSFGSTEQPTWEGIYQGDPILQMFTGDFGGRERAFAVMLAGDGSIQLWEFTDSNRNENGDNRVKWQIEFPAYTWGQEFLLKELAKFELWIDSLYGTVEFFMEYRPDGEVCWQPWWRWKECSARNSCEDLVNPICYPLQPYREGFRQTVSSPKPPRPQCSASSKRPMNRGYQFQLRLTITGWCRVRGLMVHALQIEKALYNDLVC